MTQGVFLAKKKDNTIYYRASVTYKGKHISLGSYATEAIAGEAYRLSLMIINGDFEVGDYRPPLKFDKWVSLINFRDNNIYFSNPIYVRKSYFNYYLSEDEIYTFDVDDLFYFGTHKLQKRGGRLFVSDYGMQITLKSRYGIKPFAVLGRDYEHINGDCNDYRYENLRILSKYNGVIPHPVKKTGAIEYVAKININGSVKINAYDNEITAAIAYNKAADYLKNGILAKNYILNYIEEISPKEYAEIYTKIDISDFISKLP